MSRLLRLFRPVPEATEARVAGGPADEDDAEAPAGGGKLWIFYPFEVYTAVVLAIAVLFLRYHRLRIDWRTVEYTLYPMVPLLPRALLGGIGLQVLYRLVTRRSLRDYLRRIASVPWMVLWLRMWVAAMLMTYMYFWVKISVPLINERLWDRQLWSLDVLLHFGLSPSIFVSQAFQGSPILGLLDRWYGLWVTTVFYTMAFFSAMPGELVRRRFMASCVFLWTLGAWLYMAVPALGPIYAFPQVWHDLMDQMPRARSAQIGLWENYQRIVAGRTGGLKEFNPTLGVAAMPSLHVGAHWLFALWGRRRARLLFVPFVIGTLLTLIASILTGWHYAVDGYAGLLLAWLCYRLGAATERGKPTTAPQGEGGGKSSRESAAPLELMAGSEQSRG